MIISFRSDPAGEIYSKDRSVLPAPDGFIVLFKTFLLLSFELLNALHWRRKIFGYCAAEIRNCLPNLLSYIVVRLIGQLFSLYVFPAKLRLCLGGPKEINGQFLGSHVVKNMLRFFKPLSLMNILPGKTAIQPLISSVLKNSIIF